MALYAEESGKQFSKPNTGKYVGTVIDIVDLGLKAPKTQNPAFSNAPVRRVQITWVLNVNGPDGKPLEYSEAPPLKLSEGSGTFKPTRLYTVVSGVLQTPPAKPFSTFDVESLIGKSNELFIVKTGNGNDERSEIAGFLPVPPGVVPPVAPTGFVRKALRPVGPSGNQQAAQPAQAAPAQSTQNAQTVQEVKF